MPVARATVAAGFTYARIRPFAAGQRRGVDLRARPGAPVGAACGGRVTYAGPTPGGPRRAAGDAVTVRCGRLMATHLGLTRPRVATGDVVAPGRVLGTVGPTGIVRLGARVAHDRWGWIDPLPLIQDRPTPPLLPLGRAPHSVRPAPFARAPRAIRPSPLGRAPRARRPAPFARASRPVPAPAGRAPRSIRPAPAPAGHAWRVQVGDPVRAGRSDLLPWLLAGGLALLLAAGIPVHRLVWRARTGGRRRRPAAAPDET
jgi:hypothetical protein